MKSLEAESVSGSDLDLIQNIITLNVKLSEFWGSAHGWAPDEAANLLCKSRLDWQVSLSETLNLWITKDTMSDGELILAWVNLGALLEGTLKLFFSVYYEDFQRDIEALKNARAYDKKKKTHKEPDGLGLGVLSSYASNKKLFQEPILTLFQLVRHRRNAIHAFEDRELGTVDEFRESVRSYMNFLRCVDGRVPYPDGF